MEQKNTAVAIPNQAIAERINAAVESVTGAQGMVGFQRAYLLADGIRQLKEMLTPEYMGPIMAMQGSKLGFRTDKDRNEDGSKGPGYSIEIVRDCLIEAVLMGLQPYNNQFNIIAGNMYPTKEGIGYQLNNFKGLCFDIVCGLPRLSNDGTSAAVEVTVDWTINGEQKTKVVPIPIRVNKRMGMDAIIGKATRKSRAWLISTITGIEVTDGDVEDATATVVDSKTGKSNEQHESERMTALINAATTVDQLNAYKPKLREEHLILFAEKLKSLSAKK